MFLSCPLPICLAQDQHRANKSTPSMLINIPVKKPLSRTDVLEEIRLAAQLFQEQDKNDACSIDPIYKSRIARILARAERSSGLSSIKILREFFRQVQNNQRKKIEMGDNSAGESTTTDQKGCDDYYYHLLLSFKKTRKSVNFHERSSITRGERAISMCERSNSNEKRKRKGFCVNVRCRYGSGAAFRLQTLPNSFCPN